LVAPILIQNDASLQINLDLAGVHGVRKLGIIFQMMIELMKNTGKLSFRLSVHARLLE
tara:strand:- start:376132 stop:376305 length:174 start_codon:yes stop_codon:yes gene_type:complete